MILNQSGVYGYSHSCSEIRQHLTHLLEDTRPPADLMPVLSPSVSDDAEDTDSHKASDFYVFELSSAKEISIDGHPVQLNYLNRHFRAFFSDTQRTRAYWAHAMHSDEPAMSDFLRDLPDYKRLSASDQRLLRNVRLTLTTPKQLRCDIDAIRSAVPYHLFVTHFDAKAPDGTLLKARANYLNMVRDALTECNATWYDPSPSVHAFGQNIAIDDPQKSLSHYAHSFEQYLSSDWWMRFIDPVRQRVRMERATKTRIRQEAVATQLAKVSSAHMEKV